MIARKRKSTVKSWTEMLLPGFCFVMAGIIALSSLLMLFAIVKTKSGDAQDFLGCNDIVKNIENLEINMTSVIYVKNENGEWEENQRIHGTENRIWTSMDNIPQTLIDAFVSIEDQRFFTHKGVDWKRTAGAFINYLPFINIYSSNQGGSTITQQLIKNITSDNDRNATRKLREIARALMLEKMLDKEVILEAYLNTISLGNGICGVQVAANYYFNKDVKDLSLVECASIAAITKNPTANNPEDHPQNNKDRRQLVLDKMLELDKITKEQYNAAYDADIVIDKSQQSNFEIPINSYFVDALIDNVINDISEKNACSIDTASAMLYNGGLKIYATVDPKIQDTMEKVYLNQKQYFSQRSKTDKSKTVQSSMTITDYEGHILGIVGGVGEKTVNRGLNRATSSPRQPGSTMKPLGVYTQAIDKGYATYYSSFNDKPLDNYYGTGKKGPKEWYGYYAGNMSIVKAIERSANTIPCWILKDDVGIENSYNFLTQNLGMKFLTQEDKNLSSLALGGCQYGITSSESAAAYAIFGNGGKYYEPVTYYKVSKPNGDVLLNCDIDGKQVINPGTATIMNMLLQNVVYGRQGTGRGIAGYSSMKAYAKTGTSSESNDLWMVAGTPYYVGSVWYGFDQQEKVNNAGAAATVWKAVMSEIHKGLENKEFDMERGIVTQKYCKYTGLPAGDKCHNTAEGKFVSGVLVKQCDGKHSSYSGGNTSSSSSSDTSSQDSVITTPSDTPSSSPSDPSPSSSEESSSGSSDTSGTSSDTSGSSSSSSETSSSSSDSPTSSGSSTSQGDKPNESSTDSSSSPTSSGGTSHTQ